MARKRGRGNTEDSEIESESNTRVCFLHPDLGIGGAERLIVDAALGLKQLKHNVVIYTSHHDTSHCFEETRDGTLEIRVRGDWMPRHLAGRLHIVFAIMRSIWAALCILLEHSLGTSKFDVIVVDQLSIAIPLLRLTGCRILFYCHFPDLLLTKRDSLVKKLYRYPVDWLEQETTGMCDSVLVNSEFTGGMYDKTFTRIKEVLRPTVLYPAINFSKYDTTAHANSDGSDDWGSVNDVVFLSINRFERKKNIELALQAFAKLHASLSEDSSTKAKANHLRLVLAGGYDPRVSENVEYYTELKQEAQKHGLTVADFPEVAQVVFLRSFSEQQRSFLLRRCLAVLYTPSNEHFGIVPIEAMYAGRAVLAVNSGGPLESVKESVTGFLRPPTAQDFGSAMEKMVRDVEMTRKMGQDGHHHVVERFSLTAFSRQLEGIIKRMKRREVTASYVRLFLAMSVPLLVAFVAVRYILSSI